MTKDSTENFNRIKQSTCMWRPLKYNKCDVGKNYIMSHESNTPFLTPIMTIMATSIFTYGQQVKTDVAIFVTQGIKTGVFD